MGTRSLASPPGDPAPQSPPIFSRHRRGDPTDGEDSSSITAADPTIQVRIVPIMEAMVKILLA